MGRLTRDPELRTTGTGIAVASFSVAVDRDFPDKATGQRETDFLDCVAWRHTGEFVSRNFKKGSMICVSGRLQIRSWTDKDGNKRKTAEVVADNCYFGGSRNDTTGTGTTGNFSAYPETEAMLQAYGVKPSTDFNLINDSDDQLPF
jgi:single-strand DNA-binding protein